MPTSVPTSVPGLDELLSQLDEEARPKPKPWDVGDEANSAAERRSEAFENKRNQSLRQAKGLLS